VIKALKLNASALGITAIEMVDPIGRILPWKIQGKIPIVLISLIHFSTGLEEESNGSARIGFLSLAKAQKLLSTAEDSASALIQPEFHLAACLVETTDLLKITGAKKDDCCHT
jgi:hypothetical protein